MNSKKKTKSARRSPTQMRHEQILDVVLSSVLGAIPYAKTAVLVLEIDPAMPEKLPFVGIKKRGVPMDEETLQRVTVLLKEYIASAESVIQVPVNRGAVKNVRRQKNQKRN